MLEYPITLVLLPGMSGTGSLFHLPLDWFGGFFAAIETFTEQL
ncbi:hypothetical protein [Pseudomonas sp. PA27(2017)]|nr:hypothetical protein [Pseudomonas sp. PA27(2017)]